MVKFFVPGTPAPKGSTKAFFNKWTKRIIVTADNGETQKAWCSNVSYVASTICKSLIDGPVSVRLKFFLSKPKSVKNRPYPVVKPDLDKLTRATWDALTGIAFHDDAQVVDSSSKKRYAPDGQVTGCYVVVEPYPVETVFFSSSKETKP